VLIQAESDHSQLFIHYTPQNNGAAGDGGTGAGDEEEEGSGPIDSTVLKHMAMASEGGVYYNNVCLEDQRKLQLVRLCNCLSISICCVA
jgi:hypothetical protein